MKISSAVFEDHQPIPAKYTCEGEDVSPPLTFSDLPEQAKSLALIVEDPDAPMGTFDHWIAWNIPTVSGEIPEGGHVPHQGTNHFNDQKYRGPCPPPGPAHRYFFKLYALDCQLEMPDGATKERVEEAMNGHVIAKAELVGTFKR